MQFFDNAGDPLASGTLETYLAGTSTPVATYSDVSLLVANPTTITLNSAGVPQVSGTEVALFLTPGISYKFIVKNSSGSTIFTRDNISAIPLTSGDADITGTAGEALSAGNVVYLSDGSGGQTAGRWYKADADNTYSSNLPEIGFAVADIASAASGSIRLLGRMTGLSGLVAGTKYYISATAGALTSTAPTNARFVGVAESTTVLILGPPTHSTVLERKTLINAASAYALTFPTADAAGALMSNGAGTLAFSAIALVCEGRLTLTTAVPITTSDVTAAGTIYFTPYKGSRIALYDGTAWKAHVFTERSLALTLTSGKNYDVFLYDNSGTLTLELSAAWTNDTTRADAISLQDGVYVKTGATTRRYLGTIRASGANTTEDSETKRFVWNLYNRVPRTLRKVDDTNTWSYTTATFRQANAGATNQVEVVVGLAEALLDLQAVHGADNSTDGVVAATNIGEDSTSTPATGFMGGWVQMDGHVRQIWASLRKIVPLGYHFYAWLEFSEATGTTTWYGDNGATYAKAGLTGTIEA